MTTQPKKLSPSKVLYIKLGSGAYFAEDCIKKDSKIILEYKAISHPLCSQGKWSDVKKQISSIYGKTPSATTLSQNELIKFYTEPDTTMWITFFNSLLWYCFAEKDVTPNPDGTRERRTTSGGWKCTDSQGNKLYTQSLSGALTKVHNYRATICSVYEHKYLIDKINNQQSPEILKVEQNRNALKKSLEVLIKHLNAKNFELFVDLLFRNSGWSRVGSMGSVIKDIDIELIAPVTQERSIVQVKSTASMATFNKYKKIFSTYDGYDHYYFVTHSPDKKLQMHIDSDQEDEIQIWSVEKLADMSINAGLVDWLIAVN